MLVDIICKCVYTDQTAENTHKSMMKLIVDGSIFAWNVFTMPWPRSIWAVPIDDVFLLTTEEKISSVYERASIAPGAYPVLILKDFTSASLFLSCSHSHSLSFLSPLLSSSLGLMYCRLSLNSTYNQGSPRISVFLEYLCVIIPGLYGNGDQNQGFMHAS